MNSQPLQLAIHGINVDDAGRCAHWHTAVDIVANFCTVCQLFWACHDCHTALRRHSFGRVDPHSKIAVLCGNCRQVLSAAAYFAATVCPFCNHGFNPGCALHRELYFTT